MPETPKLTRLDPPTVRAILARHPGWTLTPGLTLNPYSKRCCPLGAAVLDRAPEKVEAVADEHGDPVTRAAKALGLDLRYALGLVDGFDDDDDPDAVAGLSPEFRAGFDDGVACRAELTAIETEDRSHA